MSDICSHLFHLFISCGCGFFTVEGLEKASLANCDVVVGGSQSSQLKGKGKLSSLGKIFKPWKWRKKRTSDKFQDLSKGRLWLLVFIVSTTRCLFVCLSIYCFDLSIYLSIL